MADQKEKAIDVNKMLQNKLKAVSVADIEMVSLKQLANLLAKITNAQLAMLNILCLVVLIFM